MINKALYQQSPNIGIFSNSNNHTTLMPPTTPESFKKTVEKTLKTEILETTISNSSLIGVFTAMNDKEILTPNSITKIEEKKLKNHFNKVTKLKTKYTAIGNLVSINDNAVATSSVINTDKIGEKNMKIAGYDLVGSCLFVNNEGFLAHRDATPEELNEIEEVFQVEGDVGTVNFGDPYIKTGLIGNDNGLIAGKKTTGPELNRIDEVFILK